MLLLILFPAVAISFLISKRLCVQRNASRIYGSLLGSQIISIGTTLLWSFLKINQLPQVTVWPLATITFHALCLVFPLVFLVLYPALVLMGRRPRTKSAGKFAIGFSTALVAGAIALIEIGFYSSRIEPNWIEVTHTTIMTSKLKAGAPPLRIVQLTDLHIDHFGKREAQALDIIKRLKPDLILLTGDYTNTLEGYPDVHRFMSGLHAKYGVYAVCGNWNPERMYEKFFSSTRVRMVEHETETINIPAGRVTVGGIRWYGWGSAGQVFRHVDTSRAFTILLSHMPDAGRYAAPGVDLVVAGHTHGGQVRIPGFGPLIALSAAGRKCTAGPSRLPSGGLLYVNRGLGMEGNDAPRIRFLCRPEIAVFTIRGTGQ
jgi:uncharacterized protein